MPQSRRRQFDDVPGGVTEIKRAPAHWPFDFRLDRDSGFLQALAPGCDFGVVDDKRNVPLASCAVRWDTRIGNAGPRGIKQEEHGGAAAKGHSPAREAGNNFKPEDSMIEALRCCQIVCVKGGFAQLTQLHTAKMHFLWPDGKSRLLLSLPDAKLDSCMPEIGKMLVVLGAVIVLLGLALWTGFGAGWLGRLPGDIRIERGHSIFYFPIVTCIILSIVVSLLLSFFRR